MATKIAVVGSTNWDISLKLPRIPRPKETVAGGVSQFSLGGKGANQAVAAAKAGAEVLFVSALGDDGVAQQVRAQLGQLGMSLEGLITIPQTNTGTALIFVDEQGENCIGVADGANAGLTSDHISSVAGLMTNTSHTLIQLEIPMPTVVAAAQAAKAAGSQVILNPAPAAAVDSALLAYSDIVTPNQVEMEQIIGFKINDANDMQKAAAVLLKKGPQVVIVTLGGDGVFVASQTETFTAPGFHVPVMDTTGAGDVFNGSLAVALSEGAALRDAVQFGCAAAALSVGRAGAMSSVPNRAEIQALLAAGT
ncbi:ribokinase [Halioxenophilus aromaticivorans]|uniref:Ribokinase n=1 Tax=Halioxenophilus aromaticivorans TaxID=1306992 RepID=A0AAV3U0Z1_9ALTE